MAKVMANQGEDVEIVPERGESSVVPDPCSSGDVVVRTSSDVVKHEYTRFLFVN